MAEFLAALSKLRGCIGSQSNAWSLPSAWVRPAPACRRRAPRGRQDPMKILLSADGSTYTKRMLVYVAAHDE